jgi:hypothetical protein
LHLDGAAYGVDHAAKLDQSAVAGSLHDPPVMRGDGGIKEIATPPPQSRKRTVFVRAGEPAVANNVRDQDRRYLALAAARARRFARVARTGGRADNEIRPMLS